MKTHRGRIVLVTLAVALAALLAPHAEASTTWRQSGGSGITLTGVALSPDPVQVDVPFTVLLTGSTSTTQESATAYYTVSDGTFVLFTDSESLGDIEKGALNLTLHPPVLESVPAGAYEMEVQIIDGVTNISAVDLHVEFDADQP